MKASHVSIKGWMDKEAVVYMYTMEYYLAIKNNGILSSVATRMDLEGIMLSEIRQRKTNTLLYHLYVKSKKYNKLVN